MSDTERSDGEVQHGLHEVDIPVTVPPEMASEMAQELEDSGSIVIEVTRGNCPDIIEQINWQLENERPLTEIAEEYDAEGGNL